MRECLVPVKLNFWWCLCKRSPSAGREVQNSIEGWRCAARFALYDLFSVSV